MMPVYTDDKNRSISSSDPILNVIFWKGAAQLNHCN